MALVFNGRGGGGGSAFNGGTITQPLAIDDSAAATGAHLLEVTSPDIDFYVDDSQAVNYLTSGTSGASWNIADGTANGASLDVVDNTSFRTATLKSGTAAGDAMLLLDDGNVKRVKLGDTLFLLRINAAPADGTIAAHECSLWFDDTNGAAKLMVKAKSANGTVVTGSLALA